MTSIERLAYPRFKRLITAHELHLFFAPSRDEVEWAAGRSDSDEHLLAQLLALKSYQRMGCFPKLDEIPDAVVDFVRRAVDLPEGTVPRAANRTAERQRTAVRQRTGLGVHEDERRLKEMERENGQFLLVTAMGGEFAALAEEDDVVGAVPAFDDIEALLDLALELAVAQVADDEDGLLGFADFEHGLVDGVGGGAGEGAQDGLGGGGADPDRGGALDELVVVVLDDVPADRAGHRVGDVVVGVLVLAAGPVELDLVDLLDAGQQVVSS